MGRDRLSAALGAALLGGCGALPLPVPFIGTHPDCALDRSAELRVEPSRISRGEEVTLTGTYTADVLPPSLPDHFFVELIQNPGPTGEVIGAWAEGEALAPGLSAIRGLELVDQRTITLNVRIDIDKPPGRYLLSVAYSPAPEICPGPVEEIEIDVE